MRQLCIPGRFSLPTKRPGNEARSHTYIHLYHVLHMVRSDTEFIDITVLKGERGRAPTKAT